MRFDAYFDTGGSESSPDGTVIVTAGVVATSAKWERFDRRWSTVLNEFGVRELHMKHFSQGKGEFASWFGQVQRRAEFIRRLIAEIKRGVNKAFVTAVILPDYRLLDLRYELTEQIGGPYSLAQSRAIQRTVMWMAARKRPTDLLTFSVEKGDAGQPAFRRFIKQSLGKEPTFLERWAPNGEGYTPLQACDLLAYEYRHEYHRIVRDKRRPAESRKSLASIRRHLPVDAGVVDGEIIEQTCTMVPIPLRQPAN